MKVTNMCQVFHAIFFCCFNVQQVVTFPYCPTSRPTPNSTVHFVNEQDLVKEVHGCIMKSLSFQCCMADYVSVQWFQKTKKGTWEDFMHSPVKSLERELGIDDNQTAILKAPWDHGLDDGMYKCVGNGTRPGDTIEHSITVNLISECPDISNGPPFPFTPDEEESKLSTKLSENITVVCGAVFGTQCSISPAEPDCTFQWKKIEKHGNSTIPAGNSTSGLRVYYENSVSASSVNDLRSVLYVTDLVESDYGTYVCQMKNKFGQADRRITIEKRDIVENHSVNYVGYATVMAIAFVFVTVIVGYQFRWHICIRWNELKQGTVCYHGGKLQHDILLLHTSSVMVDTSFARYCKRKLENMGYDVIFEDDIPGGQNTISEWLKRSDESQYVVIVLSPDFLTDDDENCRLPLRNIIRRKANFLFIFFRFTIEKPTMTRMKDIKAAIQIKPKIHWSADSTAFDGNSSEMFCEQLNSASAREVNVFWRKLMSHLPQPIQTDTATALEESKEESKGCDSEVSPLLSKCAAGRRVAPKRV